MELASRDLPVSLASLANFLEGGGCFTSVGSKRSWGTVAMIPDIKLSIVNGLPLGGETALTSSTVLPLRGGGVATP